MTPAELRQRYILQRLLLKRKAQQGQLLPFTQFTFKDYNPALHVDIMAQVITMWIKKQIRFLMIFAPPQHGKSELVSRRTPPLIHGLYPNDHILTCSYNAHLASEMTDHVQKVMDSPEYQELFPNVRISPPNSSTGYARNSGGHQLIPVKQPDGYHFVPRGTMMSAGVGGSFVGKPGDWLIIDDPIKNRQDADSPVYREALWKFYQTGLRSRINVHGQVLLMHQRWHEDDLAGRLLDLARGNPEADQWHVLVMPAIRENLDDGNTWDWRQPGEPLWPELFPLKELLAKKAGGLRDFAALYQQKPTAEGGNIIKATDIRYYTSLPPKFDRVIQTWDFATKAKEQNDFSVGAAWGAVKADRYLIHQVRGRWPFPMQLKKVLELSEHEPRARAKYVEDKANGPAVMQVLQKEIQGLQEFNPLGDKLARLNAVAPQFEGGNVYLPHPSIAPWVTDLVHELTSFPAVANDDQCDATSMALLILQNSGPVRVPFAGHGGYGRTT